MDEVQAHVARGLELQARGCRMIGSPLYEAILQSAAADARSGGPVWAVLRERAGDPEDSALALRLMAAVHRFALTGRAPALADRYPSAGGDGRPEGAAEAFLAVVEEHADELQVDVKRPLQTNEVGRCAALVGGFLAVAARFRLPLTVLEVGASAGLNLRWDRYLYEARGSTWGDPASPVRLCGFNTERLPPFHVGAEVVARRGCDPDPLDPTTEDGRLALLSFVWADQLARVRLLRAAIDVARAVPAPVDRDVASRWLPAQDVPRGTAAVVFHSIVRQYMDEDEQGAFADAIARAGSAASEEAPFAYLRMEPAEDLKDVEVRLTTWPGEEDRLLARSGYHGTAVRWLES